MEWFTDSGGLTVARLSVGGARSGVCLLRVHQPPKAPGLTFEIQTKAASRFGERTVDTEAWATVGCKAIGTTADVLYRPEVPNLGDEIRWRIAGIPTSLFSFSVAVSPDRT